MATNGEHPQTRCARPTFRCLFLVFEERLLDSRLQMLRRRRRYRPGLASGHGNPHIPQAEPALAVLEECTKYTRCSNVFWAIK